MSWWEHRASQPIVHDNNDLVEVWRFDPPAGDRQPRPYLQARCECGWFSQYIYGTTPRAWSRAFATARRHGTRVAHDLVQD
ncbi:hypothetical protein GCM10009682_59670 [Luedemannella flava]|uniref:Uncharacterized protein n=1 Tax=Luedemannella flava TaxID=349316 RepID=A0ABP4YZA6_9ACTN